MGKRARCGQIGCGKSTGSGVYGDVQETTDRLLVAWNVATDPDAPLRDGEGVSAPILVPTPDDILTMRRTDPGESARWRTETRQRFLEHLGAGRHVVGFTRDGHYVFAS